ncbi:hypothetical protein P7K49_035617 [Saguinus oedipus]|uniref:Uncharacterized protein n=1 Tax=Saguinus oedipus TaxID=9490 RepID=A0ABQ9TN37_SAGOE|nr:hypothetical protein P7K49_035617 [Saguinus oedipus]
MTTNKKYANITVDYIYDKNTKLFTAKLNVNDDVKCADFDCTNNMLHNLKECEIRTVWYSLVVTGSGLVREEGCEKGSPLDTVDELSAECIVLEDRKPNHNYTCDSEILYNHRKYINISKIIQTDFGNFSHSETYKYERKREFSDIFKSVECFQKSLRMLHVEVKVPIKE